MTTSRSERRFLRSPTARNRVVLLALCALTTAAAACRRKAEPAPQPREVTAVAAPASLVLSGAVPAPQQFWERVRAGLGQRGQSLPKHYPLMLTELLSVSPVVTGRFEGERPLRFAVSVHDEEALGWAVAVKLRSGGELVAELSTGASAPYRAVPDGAVVRLQRPGVEESPARGVSRNYLVLASDAAALSALGPYLAATSLEDQTRAPAEGLALESVPGAGPRLASVWRGAVGLHRSRLLARFDALFDEGISSGFKRVGGVLFDALASTVERALRVTEHSRVTVEVDERRLRLSAAQRAPSQWSASARACEVARDAPLPNPLLAVVWGAAGMTPLIAGQPEAPGGGAGQPATGAGAPDGVELADVSVASPGILGAAEIDGELHGFARFESSGSSLAETTQRLLFDGRAAGRWFERKRSRPGGAATAVWSYSTSADQRLPSTVQVALDERDGRARWTFGRDAAKLLDVWGKGPASTVPWPWSAECSRVMFAVTAGQPGHAVAAWTLAAAEGFEVLAEAPLELFADRWLAQP